MIKKIRDKNVSFVDEKGNRRLSIRQQEKPPHSQPIWIFDSDFGLNPQSALRDLKCTSRCIALTPRSVYLINERWTAVPCARVMVLVSGCVYRRPILTPA
jgi:hypothetical protein